MKRASYRDAVAWIAEMDESASRDVEFIAELPTVLLISYIFDTPAARVAADVLRIRSRS